jgi:hypothetical protein
MVIADGTATVAAAGERADCVITADPVAFLLLGYGRSPSGHRSSVAGCAPVAASRGWR